MKVYVIHQPEALDVRDISAHILDYLDHRYGRNHVSSTGRPGDAGAHATALARATVVVALIGPSWSANTDPRVVWELDQALARRRFVVPALLGGAALPSPTTPALAALATRQTVSIRPDPEMAKDLNRLFSEINTQLGWAPMSGPLLAVAALLAVATGVFLTFEITHQIVLAADMYFQFLALESLVTGVGLWVAWRRRARWWAAAIGVTAAVMVAEIFDLNQLHLFQIGWIHTLGTAALPLALLAFALFGPRRELQRLAPPRIWRPAARRAAHPAV